MPSPVEPEFRATQTLQPFSPRWTNPDLLEKTSVGRKPLIDKLEQLVLEGAGGPNKYQRLLIGPRGSGKTHVLRVLQARLLKNQDLRQRLLIAYLLEDELGVASFVDFLVRILRAIIAWYPEHASLATDLNELLDLPAGAKRRRATDLLLKAAAGRDILIIMENLGVTFDAKQGFGRKGQQAFRDLVQQNPNIMVFASSQALVDGISEPNAPFYLFFRIEDLPKLTLEEAMDLLRSVAEAYGNQDVVKALTTPEGRARVRAIYDFTGGNHRLLITFYDFLAADSLIQLGDAFLEALKPLKPYYQEQMRGLSAQQQKIVQYLSMERVPRTVQDIARGCLATSNTVSRQLKTLLDRKFVARIPQGRETYYEMAETLFRICYEADLDHKGAPVRLFVDFLGNYYTAKELEVRARGFGLLANLRRPETAHLRDEAMLHVAALRRYFGQEFALPEERAEGAHWDGFFTDLQNIKAYKEIISFAKLLGDDKTSEVVLVEADAHFARGDTKEACAVLRKELLRSPKNPLLHFRFGFMLLRSVSLRDADISLQETLRMQPSSILESWLWKLPNAPEVEGEAAQLTDLTNSGEASLWDFRRLWALHHRRKEQTKAQDVLRKALDAFGSDAQALLLLAGQLSDQDLYAQAIDLLERALSLHPALTRAWEKLGEAHEQLNNMAEAEACFRRAWDSNSDAAESLFRLLEKQQRWTDMEEEARTQLARTPKHCAARQALWSALFNQDRFPDLLRVSRQWANLAPDDPDAMFQLGAAAVLMWLFTSANYFEEGEQALLKAEPSSAHPFLGLAHYIGHDHTKAEKYLRRGAELNSEPAIGTLAELLSETDRAAEAENLLRTALIRHPGDARIRVALAKQVRSSSSAEAQQNLGAAATLATEPREDAAIIFELASLRSSSNTTNQGAAVLEVIQARRAPGISIIDRDVLAPFLIFGRRIEEISPLLEALLQILKEANRLEPFQQTLSATVFHILRATGRVDDARFAIIAGAIRDIASKYLDVTIPLKFLEIGRRYLRHKDPKALMELTLEERNLLIAELKGFDEVYLTS